MNITNLNTPLLLTLIRLIFSPLILPVGLIYIAPYNSEIFNGLLALFFVFLSLTDFFDGYLARKYNQETLVGKSLDPLADKFLLFSALIALVVIKRIFFFWAIVFIGREFFIMGLRILALEHGFDVKVSLAGKIKTTVQIVYITILILQLPLFQIPVFLGCSIEHIMLGAALLFSLGSAWQYYQKFMRHFSHR